VVVRALALPRANRMIGLALLQLLVILSTPTVFKQIAMGRKGFLPELAVYLAWWVAGLMPVIAAVLFWPRETAESSAPAPPRMGLAAIYVVVPFLSVLLHVYGAGWVYKVYLAPPHASPVLLGLAVGVGALRARLHPAIILKWQAALVVAALLFSLGDHAGISFKLAGVSLTPLRLTLAGAVAVAVHVIWQFDRMWAVLVAAISAAAATLWPNLPFLWELIVRILGACWRFVLRLIPVTAIEWGVTCVVAAFVLLAAGAVFSLRRKPAAESPTPTDDTPRPDQHEPGGVGNP
jgi:hypothetical protein